VLSIDAKAFLGIKMISVLNQLSREPSEFLTGFNVHKILHITNKME